MTPERWEKVRGLFDAAAELAPDQRAAFLAQAGDGDAALVREVEALLASLDGAESFLEQPAYQEAPPPLAGEPAGRPARERIGPYRLERVLGHGGMGSVYLAVRTDQGFTRQAALKLIRAGDEADFIVRRFELERQILAGLDHPNIARLIDGGSTEDGLPYLVMDYIEGETLLAYCDAKRLAVPERLRLFRQVCAAVQYAHQRLVVHRDLKPSNILVSAGGIPKLLDFGIAKLLQPEASARLPAPTVTRQRMLTPAYASPEQMRGEQITTASDVYSLGVILYELLAGHAPYRVRGERPEALVKAVCETEPEKPSTAIGRRETAAKPAEGEPVTPTPELVSFARGTVPRRLRRTLRGDLDNIVLMALRKEPQRRYASIEQLSADLKRFQEGHPVVARPDTIGYRTRKFVLRHAVGLSVAAAVGVMMAGLVGYYTGRLREERNRAQLEAQKATQVAAFLSSLFEVSNPFQFRGKTLSARDLLERGAERIRTELAGEPEVQATMMDLIGTVYLQTGEYERARPLLVEALSRRRGLLGPAHAETGATLSSLGLLEHATGNSAAARPLLEKALAIQTRALGAVHRDVAKTVGRLGSAYKGIGDYEEARRHLERAVQIQEQVGGPNDPDLAKALNNLALVEIELHRLPQARRHLERAVAIHEHNGGPNSSLVATSLDNLSGVLRMLGDLERAHAVENRAIAIVEKAFGPEHPLLGTALVNLGAVLKAMERYSEAIPIYRRAIEVYEQGVGPDHPSVAYAYRNLASLYKAMGEPRTALPLYVRALAIRERALGPDHPMVAQSLSNLGALKRILGDGAAAESLLQRALKIQRAALPPDSPQLADTLVELGMVFLEQENPSGAEPLLVEGLTIRRKGKPAGDPEIQEAEAALARCRATPGRST